MPLNNVSSPSIVNKPKRENINATLNQFWLNHSRFETLLQI